MSLVKALREQSGAPITECKDAIAAAVAQSPAPSTDADLLSLATDVLRKKGISTASKKSGRAATEGLVAVAVDGRRTRAAVVEVNSETDFAARNERFQSAVHSVAQAALAAPSPSASAESSDVSGVLAAAAGDGGQTVAAMLTDTVTVLRENIQLRRSSVVSVQGQGAIGVYVHNAVAAAPSSSASSSSQPPSTRLGRTACAVALSFSPSASSTISLSSSSSSSSSSSLSELANRLAMQVTAASPTFLSVASIPAAVLEHERSILATQTALKAKDPKHTQRIVDGKLNKYYEEHVLTEQRLVVALSDAGQDGEVGKLRVREALEREGQARGGRLEVTAFVKYTVGEGIKRDESKRSFAEEVASKLSG